MSPTDSTPASDLEDALKRDNPKGRLWELCAAARTAPPTIRHAASGVRHRVQMELAIGDWELDSGVMWGGSRKVAEQMAAAALLEELAALEAEGFAVRPAARARPDVDLGDDLFDVDAADVERLRDLNAKGQVFEWCQKQKPPVRRPGFESCPLGAAGFAVRARLETLGLVSPWFRASRRKEAEQAAAEGLLHLLPGDGATPNVRTVHPRSRLNELVQQGVLSECHIDVTDRAGATHTPVFAAEGLAVVADGREIRSGPSEASTKRGALEQAALELLEQLERSDCLGENCSQRES